MDTEASPGRGWEVTVLSCVRGDTVTRCHPGCVAVTGVVFLGCFAVVVVGVVPVLTEPGQWLPVDPRDVKLCRCCGCCARNPLSLGCE